MRFFLIFLLIFTGLNACVAGCMFMLRPGGELLGMDTSYLKHSPFDHYFLPGLVLFLVIGIFSLYTGYAVIRNRSYSLGFARLQGVLLCGWIAIQVTLVREINFLHITMFSVGVATGLISRAIQKNVNRT